MAKVTGKAKFGADINVSGQLYGAVLHSRYAHAKLLNIDVSGAKALPGVRAVISGVDCKFLFGGLIADQPVLADGKARYWGEPVAAVAADDLYTAKEALRLIKAEYEPLPIVETIEDSLKADVLVHEDWSVYDIHGDVHPVAGTNIVDKFVLKHGDIEEGFKLADVVAENEFYCAMLQHVPIETHAAIAEADENSCHIISPVQSPFAVRAMIADAFGYGLDRVRITCTEIGGGFGSKYEPRLEPIAIVLSRASGKPVKLVYERDEEFAAALCRAPVKFQLKTGASKDGKLTAQSVKIWWDTGAYATVGPRINYNAGFAANGPYHIPNSFVDSYCIVSNKAVGTAYRGFGVAEIACAHEMQMDALAEKLSMDPLEFRLRNVLRDGQESVTGEVMQSAGVAECLEKAAMAIDWQGKPLRWVTQDGKMRGKGIACYMRVSGTPSTTSCMLRMNDDGSVTLLSGSREMGQGVETVLPQIAASVLGMKPERIVMSPVDTAFTPYDKTTTSSRSTFHSGNAVMQAARLILEQLKPLVAKKWKIDTADVEFRDGMFTSVRGASRSLHIDDVGKSGILKEETPVIAVGVYGSKDIFDPPDPDTHQSKRPTVMWMMGAQAVEVEVDPGTGCVKIIKIGAAHDVGKAVNPSNCRQQIEGAVLMGVGNALTEEMIYADGELVNGNMVDYKVPTSMDADFETVVELVECPHPEGPYGVKGIGEMGLAPTSPAIGNAISAACGHRFKSVPIKSEHILLRED